MAAAAGNVGLARGAGAGAGAAWPPPEHPLSAGLASAGRVPPPCGGPKRGLQRAGPGAGEEGGWGGAVDAAAPLRLYSRRRTAAGAFPSAPGTRRRAAGWLGSG